MTTGRKLDMWDDCHRRARIEDEMRRAVAAQNEAVRTIRELKAEAATIDARIAGRMKAAGLADAAVVVGEKGVVTLGPRGEVQFREAFGPLAGVFGDAASGPEDLSFPAPAEAVADSHSADDDLREAAAHFDPASLADLDDADIRDSVFQMAVGGEVDDESREIMLSMSLSVAGGN